MLREKFVDKLLQAAVSAVASGGIAVVLRPSSVGRMAFDSFANEVGLDIVNENLITEETYLRWGNSIISRLMLDASRSSMLTLGGFAIAFVMIAHVLVRSALDDTPVAELPRYLAWYRRLHRVVTLVFILSTLAVIRLAPTPAVLMTIYVVLVIPSLLYVAYYCADVRNHKPFDTLVYIAVAASCVLATLTVPSVFGARMFDLQLLLQPPYDNTSTASKHAAIDELPGTFVSMALHDRLVLRLEPSIRPASGVSRISARALASFLPHRELPEPQLGSARSSEVDGPQFSIDTEGLRIGDFKLGQPLKGYRETLLNSVDFRTSLLQQQFFGMAPSSGQVDWSLDGNVAAVSAPDGTVVELLSHAPPARTRAGVGVGSTISEVVAAYGEPTGFQGANCGGVGGVWLVYEPGLSSLLPGESGLRFLTCNADAPARRVLAVSIFYAP
jgi:hypothetical protein